MSILLLSHDQDVIPETKKIVMMMIGVEIFCIGIVFTSPNFISFLNA